MSAFNPMSWFSAGASNPTQPSATPPQDAPKPVPPGGSAQLENTPNADDPNKSANPASPLDRFEKLWEPKKVDANNPDVASSFANVDPKKVVEMANGVNFSANITPETMQAIAAGGEEAVKAFATALNSVGSTVFAQNTVLTSKMIAQALEQQRNEMTKQLPGMMKRESLATDLSSIPILNHPAAAPLKTALTNQFAQQFPDASQQELAKMASDYLQALGSGLAPQKEETETSSKKKEPDWSSFLPE
jgi:hypothetical protein